MTDLELKNLQYAFMHFLNNEKEQKKFIKIFNKYLKDTIYRDKTRSKNENYIDG